MTQGSCATAAEMRSAEVPSAEMPAAEMPSAEMTATTVATTATTVATTATTVAAAATAAAGKGVGRETQRAKGDAQQEHSCCLGHHDFSPDIGPRVFTRRVVHLNVCSRLETT